MTPKNSYHEGKTRLRPNTTLDSLYMSVLQVAFGDDNPEDDHKIHSVLSAVILAVNPISPSTIATLLGLETEDVFPVLSLVQSLLILQEDMDLPVQPFHKSFHDFIIDPSRCTNQRFHITPPNHHSEILIGCLNLMNQELEQNMCRLPDATTNSEVNNLQERTEKYLNPALQYACRSWHKHLVCTEPTDALHITPVLHQFLEGKFLFWLEVLSILGAARDAVDALDVTMKWLDVCWPFVLSLSKTHQDLIQESPTLDLVNDCFQFVLAFFEVINTSAPHIYHSALLLSPKTSVIHKLYKSCTQPLVRVVQGLPVSWDPVVTTTKYATGLAVHATWSPCSTRVAVAFHTGTVEILDAVTLERLDSFESPPTAFPWLSFSPDGCLLTQFSSEQELTSWDLQTGGLIGTIHSEPNTSPTCCFSSTYSTNGKMVAVAHKDSDTTTTISIYNLLSKAHTGSHHVSERCVIAPIWTHGECIRFVTVEVGFTTVWEVGFTSTEPPVQVKSLPTPDNINHSKASLFLPTLSWLAFILQEAVIVWDAQDSKLLLDFVDTSEPMMMSFSPDGHFFMCGTGSHETYIWEESSTGYVLHQKFTFRSHSQIAPILSPNGESIIVLAAFTIYQCYTTGPITSLSSSPAQHVEQNNFILEFSPDETLGAVARLHESIVTVLNLQSGDPWLIVDAGMKVLGLKVTGSTIVVVGKTNIVTWNLPTGKHTHNVRVNINDCAQNILFGSPLPTHHAPVHCVSISPDLSYLAVVIDTEGVSEGIPRGLNIYDMSTGVQVTHITTMAKSPWFTPDGDEIWSSIEDLGVEGWSITRDSETGNTNVEPLGPDLNPAGGLPWESPHDCRVVDGWIFSSCGKRVFWLPHDWRSISGGHRMVWGRLFLGLLQCELPEVVILELFESSA